MSVVCSGATGTAVNGVCSLLLGGGGDMSDGGGRQTSHQTSSGDRDDHCERTKPWVPSPRGQRGRGPVLEPSARGLTGRRRLSSLGNE